MRQEVGPRHPVYTRTKQHQFVRRSYRVSTSGECRGWRGGGWASSRWLSLVRRTAPTSLGVGTPPRRNALDSETRKRDREVPRHEDEILPKVILRTNIRFRVRGGERERTFTQEARALERITEKTPIHFEGDRSPLRNWRQSIASGTRSISREYDSRGSSNCSSL